MPRKQANRKPARSASAGPLGQIRKQLVRSLHDERVHASFEKIFEGIPPELRGVKASGQPFTLWQLLEHLRLCVLDFLDYCRVAGYREPEFPKGFWPRSDSPESDEEWRKSIRGFRATLKSFEKFILDPRTDLLAEIAGSNGRTVLRQALGCLDHNGYHLGQAVLVRRALGIWDQ